MVESLSELNRLCQKPRYKEVGNWMVRHLVRDAALPVTWLLLHTQITANQVTLISLLAGIVGVSLLAFPSSGFFLAGAVLMQTWYLLDHVDGQIARYRKTASLTGRFFDFMTHHLMHGVVFFGLGVFCFQNGNRNLFPLVWGFVASLSVMMFNLSYDAKYKTFFEQISRMKQVEVFSSVEGCPLRASQPEKNFWKKGFSIVHKACEIHVLMNILTVSAFLQTVLGWSLDLRIALFAFYGIAVPFVAITKIAFWIVCREIDAEFESNFREISDK
ncbi:MAG TPA: CDP-alcohol phosphatidyltransferase family protein [Candidatus Omnitrophota bacterium]|nr:CDP-alcohol phosphatidyltransferase family protein [Candidatus Omnitrophota bacterium]